MYLLALFNFLLNFLLKLLSRNGFSHKIQILTPQDTLCLQTPNDSNCLSYIFFTNLAEVVRYGFSIPPSALKITEI